MVLDLYMPISSVDSTDAMESLLDCFRLPATSNCSNKRTVGMKKQAESLDTLLVARVQ